MSAMIDLDRLRYLASPDAERMSDYQRLNEFVKFGLEAADEIERLRALSPPEPTDKREVVKLALMNLKEHELREVIETLCRVGHIDIRRLSLQERVWPQSRQVPENWRPVPCDGLQKIMALLPPPPLTQDGLTHRFEGPNPHDTIYAIRAAFIEMLHAKPVLVEDRTEGEGMKLEISKDWCLRAAEREGDSEVGAGAIAMDPTLCDDCPPFGHPTDKTRCAPCPRRMVAEEGTK